MMDYRKEVDYSQVKNAVKELIEQRSKYNGPVIDDYSEYHHATEEPYHPEFGSIVTAMTPIGETYVFRVRGKRDSMRYIVEVVSTDE